MIQYQKVDSERKQVKNDLLNLQKKLVRKEENEERLK
jgi:hypothetical protein